MSGNKPVAASSSKRGSEVVHKVKVVLITPKPDKRSSSRTKIVFCLYQSTETPEIHSWHELSEPKCGGQPPVSSSTACLAITLSKEPGTLWICRKNRQATRRRTAATCRSGEII